MHRLKSNRTNLPTVATAILISTSSMALAAEEIAVASKSFFDQFVRSGGMIVWLLLLPMSVMTIYLVVSYLITLRKSKLLPANSSKPIIAEISQRGMLNISQTLAKNKDMVSTAFSRALSQAGSERRKGYYRVLVAESLQEQTLELMRRIDWLNIIGNVAPMIGLFGTVFGMIKAFNGIVIAGGQPRPDHLAGGISMALVTTFWGLLVAIPALAVHGIFRNRIETIASEAALQCEDILEAMESHLLDSEDETLAVS